MTNEPSLANGHKSNETAFHNKNNCQVQAKSEGHAE